MTATSEQERLLIGETWVPATAGTVRDVLDPASGEVIAQVADAGPADVDAAARHPASSPATPTSTRPSPAACRAACSTPDKSAPLTPGCWWTAAGWTSSLTNLPPPPSR